MAQSKTSLARKGTMQAAAEDAVTYLYPEKNIDKSTRKPYQWDYLRGEAKATLKNQGVKVPDVDPATNRIISEDEDEEEEDEEEEEGTASGSSTKDGKGETSDEPPTKKAKLTKSSTMVATAKEAKGLLGNEKLGATRQVTAKTTTNGKKTSLKRADTIGQTLQAAQFLLDGKEVDVTEGRKTRTAGKSSPAKPKPAVKRAGKASPAKPAMKRAGTMQNTASEGKNYLQRIKGRK